MVRELGAEDWNRGDGAGQSDGERTVQTAGVERNILDTWRMPRERSNQQILKLTLTSLYLIQLK